MRPFAVKKPCVIQSFKEILRLVFGEHQLAASEWGVRERGGVDQYLMASERLTKWSVLACRFGYFSLKGELHGSGLNSGDFGSCHLIPYRLYKPERFQKPVSTFRVLCLKLLFVEVRLEWYSVVIDLKILHDVVDHMIFMDEIREIKLKLLLFFIFSPFDERLLKLLYNIMVVIKKPWNIIEKLFMQNLH